ncbi:MAG: hypothetical protein KH290_12750 [Roseburia sp.]|nr:hypothetical protein [Roseburia sp.]
MAIKPILFNTEMVRAILDGRKSCTRRLVKTRRKDACGFYVTKKADGTFSGIYEYDENESMFDNPLMPPYQPGDILYVRETWHKYIKRVGEGKSCHLVEFYGYKASIANSEDADEPWKPSIHMPKEAARIWIKVTNVRVERLQEMWASDVPKEGIYFNKPTTADKMLMAFAKLWNSTIKKSDLDSYGWNANPWVWVIEFERCEKPET